MSLFSETPSSRSVEMSFTHLRIVKNPLKCEEKLRLYRSDGTTIQRKSLCSRQMPQQNKKWATHQTEFEIDTQVFFNYTKSGKFWIGIKGKL